jgi:mannose/fructose/N-acetylgalactosamine-specific phosphotransferase system component IIC
MMEGATLWLVIWGVIVGLDLIAVPQIMVNRPFVAGTVAGAIVGDIGAGVLAGGLLELFAFEVMPFGAARYPDYGIGAVVAAAAAAHAPGVLSLGESVAVGLAVAYGGEWGIRLVRRANSRDVIEHQTAIDGGDYRVMRSLHLRGLARESARALVLVLAGLGVVSALRHLPQVTLHGAVGATIVAVGIGLGTAFASGLRLSGSTRNHQLWYAAGAVLGVLIVWIR